MDKLLEWIFPLSGKSQPYPPRIPNFNLNVYRMGISGVPMDFPKRC